MADEKGEGADLELLAMAEAMPGVRWEVDPVTGEMRGHNLYTNSLVSNTPAPPPKPSNAAPNRAGILKKFMARGNGRR